MAIELHTLVQGEQQTLQSPTEAHVVSERDDLPDLETVCDSDEEEWDLEGVLDSAEVQESSAAGTATIDRLHLNRKSTTPASPMLLGYISFPSSVGPTLPDIGIDTTHGHANLRPLYGRTIGAAPAAHGTAGVTTVGPVLADRQRIRQISDENACDAGWRSPVVCDGYCGRYSETGDWNDSAADDLAQG
ncbi:uncharacterized protein TRAVEDRAFT_53678 [Trametes versicolor FP-101664 SS1]|uniref:uncharacterized protein n=1 Tax=Trametes versicolor (strain FP-101664) TaxID=717944 RepID=UPI0004622336|nr:uncharacterized protein TRAVEDRAFT_53678 [Trametes versicolor FP-101664 SS1]EIW52250.1 hypothetical protein TRAVEDRAFT_53678 [Trametes versicolor FP-101664 SS1]